MKFSTVASGIRDDGSASTFGLVRELKSNARPILFGSGGKLIFLFSQRVGAPESNRKGNTEST